MTPDLAQIEAYLSVLFGPWDWEDGDCLALRGVGDKGTPAADRLTENVVVPLDVEICDVARAVASHVERWNRAWGGAFLIPGVVRPVMQAGQPHFTTESVTKFTNLVVDLDKGDPLLGITHLSEIMGRPNMIVESGGLTELGKRKTHAYWVLNEPTADVARIAREREEMALAVGGDISFKRIPQIIRIPGSYHLKNQNPTPVRIVYRA